MKFVWCVNFGNTRQRMLNSVYNMTLICISLFCGEIFNILSLGTQLCSRHHYKLDSFTDLVYRLD